MSHGVDDGVIERKFHDDLFFLDHRVSAASSLLLNGESVRLQLVIYKGQPL
jgi:hypothetical protein